MQVRDYYDLTKEGRGIYWEALVDRFNNGANQFSVKSDLDFAIKFVQDLKEKHSELRKAHAEEIDALHS